MGLEYFQIFDQEMILTDQMRDAVQAHHIGETLLQISELVIDFASIERVPRYCVNKRENDAEHSFMLALAGIEVSSTYYPGLDSGLIGKMALVHDFPELHTGYDVATFDISDEELAQKHANEQAGLPEFIAMLPPHLGDLLQLYEEQQLPEAKIVKHLDKLLPNAVNTTGAGVAVMREDYQVHSVEKFIEKNQVNETRFNNLFTDTIHTPLHHAHSYLAAIFADQLSETL